ncbi:hypothetical protein AAG570_013580 [Ranatra chinensis]|uniref:Uncharacterized protein n=1 Tax=Ranatra chinensis TaxID=642074 RepID=A0ABD0YCL7_9HEMI
MAISRNRFGSTFSEPRYERPWDGLRKIRKIPVDWGGGVLSGDSENQVGQSGWRGRWGYGNSESVEFYVERADWEPLMLGGSLRIACRLSARGAARQLTGGRRGHWTLVVQREDLCTPSRQQVYQNMFRLLDAIFSLSDNGQSHKMFYENKKRETTEIAVPYCDLGRLNEIDFLLQKMALWQAGGGGGGRFHGIVKMPGRSSGATTTDDLSDDFGESVKEKVEAVVDDIEEKMHSLVGGGKEQVQNIKEEVNEKKDKIEDMVEDLEDVITKPEEEKKEKNDNAENEEMEHKEEEIKSTDNEMEGIVHMDNTSVDIVIIKAENEERISVKDEDAISTKTFPISPENGSSPLLDEKISKPPSPDFSSSSRKASAASTMVVNHSPDIWTRSSPDTLDHLEPPRSSEIRELQNIKQEIEESIANIPSPDNATSETDATSLNEVAENTMESEEKQTEPDGEVNNNNEEERVESTVSQEDSLEGTTPNNIETQNTDENEKQNINGTPEDHKEMSPSPELDQLKTETNEDVIRDQNSPHENEINTKSEQQDVPSDNIS